MTVWARTFLLLFVMLFITEAALASQYRSRELAAPSSIADAEKSIEELEEDLADMHDAYGRASTARFLARHYASDDAQKAAQYYQQALQGEGLSDYAKQDVLAELASVYLRLEQYRQVLESLEKRKALGGKDNTRLLIIKAMAHHHLQENKQAIASADAAWASESRPDDSLLRQLLFIYYNNGAYKNAANVQQHYLQKHPDNLSAWRQLAAIYLKMANKSRAADALSVAKHKNLPLTEQDWLLLADLYADAGNPYAAARVLSEAMAQGNLPQTISHLDRQFHFWLMARERGKAIETLQKALVQQPDIERYLQLARLQMEEEQWQAMNESVTSACEIALPDRFVSRANVLLGISELRLGNRAAAREAFINATLIGGEGQKAAEYLRYMEAETASDEEQASFDGVCTPRWARTRAEQLAIATGRRGQRQQEQDEQIDYTIKTSPEQTLVTGRFTLAVEEMERRLLPLAMQMGTHIVKNRGRIDGDMHFLFPEPIEEDAEVISFTMAFPVSRVPQSLGRYRVLEDKGYTSASLVFEGAPEDLPDYWLKLYQAVTADGHQPSGSGRQIVLEPNKASRENVKLELQLGID